MFVGFMPLYIFIMLMSALVFYFVNRSHSKFKFDLNNGKLFSILLWPWARILAQA
jgi:hypothetical protein